MQNEFALNIENEKKIDTIELSLYVKRMCIKIRKQKNQVKDSKL